MKYIFLHGLGQGYQMWNPVLSYLGKKYDVESPDLYEWFSGKQISTLTKSMMNLDFCEELEKIRCRTLAIVGTKDKANKKAFLCIREKIQNCAGYMIPGAGHEVNRDSPEVLAETLKMFFES